MTEIVRKLMVALALLVVGGLVLGGTMAFAGGSPTPSAAVSSSSASDSPSQSVAPGTANDDGTPDQGPGDVPVVGGNASTTTMARRTRVPATSDGVEDDNDGDDGEHNDDHGDEVEDDRRRQLRSEREQRPGQRRRRLGSRRERLTSRIHRREGGGAERRRRPRSFREPAAADPSAASICPRWPTIRTPSDRPASVPHRWGRSTRSSSLASRAPRPSHGSLAARTSTSATSPSSGSPSTAA